MFWIRNAWCLQGKAIAQRTKCESAPPRGTRPAIHHHTPQATSLPDRPHTSAAGNKYPIVTFVCADCIKDSPAVCAMQHTPRPARKVSCCCCCCQGGADWQHSHIGPCTTCSPGTRLEQVCVDPLEQHKPRRLGSAAGAILSSLSSGLATRLVYVAAQIQASTLFRHHSGQETQPGGLASLFYCHCTGLQLPKGPPSDGNEWMKAIYTVQEGRFAGSAAAFLRVLLAQSS